MSDMKNYRVSDMPADTLDQASAALYFLSSVDYHAIDMTARDSFGLSLILLTIKDALDYESDRVIRKPEKVKS